MSLYEFTLVDAGYQVVRIGLLTALIYLTCQQISQAQNLDQESTD